MFTMPAVAADLTPRIPGFCSCSNYFRWVSDSTSFEMHLPEEGYPGGGGLCSIAAYLMEEEYCPAEPGCFADIRILAIRVLSQLQVNRRAECTPFLFPPMPLPFVQEFRIGPFQPGQHVDVHVNWFTHNLDQARSIVGPLGAAVSQFGVHFTGQIPADATAGTIVSELEVSNRRASRRASYLIEIRP